MIKNRIAWTVVAALIVIAAIVWRDSDPTGEAGGQVGAVDPEQATVERMLERTRRESRTGVEEPVSEAPPEAPALFGAAQQADGSRQDVSEPEAASSDSGLDPDLLPEGYTLGTYRGAMQRAPLTSAPEPVLSPNPDWLEPGSSPDEILDQAARSGREITFAVLRVLPGTDLQALNRSLAPLGARIEGSTGPFVRVRVPVERDRLDAIAELDGVLGIGAVPPELKADEAFVQELLARPANEPVPVYITLMADDIAGEWRQVLTELGVVVGAYDRDLRSYTANLTPAALTPILDADFVMSLESVPVVTVNHESSVPVMGVDAFRQYDPATESFSGITGSGITVGVLDTGLNASHVDIAHGRASICGANFHPDEDWDLWMDLHGHGTHVFGTIAGAGRADPVLAGIAPGLSHLRFGKVLSHKGAGRIEDIRRGMDYLSRPTSCSWQGVRSEAVKPMIVNMSLAATALTFSGRGVGERKLDSLVHGRSQLYVVAQANAGLHGFSNFGTAKNSLAVGCGSRYRHHCRVQQPRTDGRWATRAQRRGHGRQRHFRTWQRLGLRLQNNERHQHGFAVGRRRRGAAHAGAARISESTGADPCPAHGQRHPAACIPRKPRTASGRQHRRSRRIQQPLRAGPGLRTDQLVFSRRTRRLAHRQRALRTRQRQLRVHRYRSTRGRRPPRCRADLG